MVCQANKFLVSAGLSEEDARKVCDSTGANTVDDLLLLASDLEAVSKDVGLKLVPAKKLRTAVETLQTKTTESSTSAVPVLPSPSLKPTLKPSQSQESPTTPTSASVAATQKQAPSQRQLEECVAIAIDRSGSMGCGFDEMRAWCDDGNQRALEKTLERRSRMDAVKQIFYAFRDRTSTLGTGSHKLGLIQFDSEVEQMMDLEADLQLFEAIVDDMQKRGSTAIYSAIVEAARMLTPVFKSQPEVDLRILVLTDGQSNSGASPTVALQAAFNIGAVVDAIIVGDTPDENLRKIVNATGGSCYQIKTLSEGFELMEAEAVVSLRARRGGTDKPAFEPNKVVDSSTFGRLQAETLVRGKNAAKAAAAKAPPAPKPKKLVNSVDLCAIARKTPSRIPGGGATKRILKELRTGCNNLDGVHLFPDAENIFLMRALIEGPPGTPFETGVFCLNINIPQDYPFKPPKVQFATPVYHCNVNETGGLCMDILKNQWSPALTIPKVLTSIRNLLGDPNTDDALRNWIAELTIMNRKSGGADSRYVDAARASTAKYASRSVDEWKATWDVE